MIRILDSELINAEYETYLGKDSKFVADLALTRTMIAALSTVGSVTLHASSSKSLQNVGESIAFVI